MENACFSIGKVKEKIRLLAENIAMELHPLWVQIHNNPEIGYKEYRASGLLGDWLSRRGFSVKRPVANMDTAFIGELSHLEPNASKIIFLAEYDALPEIGHACGHSLSGIASVLAGAILAEIGASGTVAVAGTPAEEAVVPDAGGKLSCIEAGLFNGADAVMMAHAAPKSVLEVPVLARAVVDVEWLGLAAHAGAEPHKGKNALSAAILALNACNSLYQQLQGECRINPIIRSGGTLVNTIPDLASASIQLRAPTRYDLENLIERIKACLLSGGMATGCETHISFPSKPVSDMCQSETLLNVYGEMLTWLDIPYQLFDSNFCISTDAGNVSYAAPFIHPFFGLNLDAQPPLHSIHFREACKTQEAYRAMICAAAALAWTGWVVQTNSEMRKRVKEEFDKKFAPAIPGDTKPCGGRDVI